ncbi:hypothetical protein COCMIDRAFT_30597 [Bipolaris oryzae ATCC 44560]|uniref:Peptide hydrolase n=1 Tax=Bipolaris oryzae ATCC 44560 TaxID=930090 RepID=W6YY41_COCMI|nr:uncharacterized protein COCMIDRAFT_30597 [Bipolaris oryzae ATCC 44560]EUC40479.1 hypothetical protein COCMIDRAFT_30597 [Bipolaris oryzae ATCC 44560]
MGGFLKIAIVRLRYERKESNSFSPWTRSDGLARNIAIITHGTCNYGIKSALAGSVGASEAILYNINDDGPVEGTLLLPPWSQGPYVPMRNIKNTRSVTTSKFFATTKSGDQNKKLILGAGTDSIIAGPVSNAVTFAFWTAEELYQHPASSHLLSTLSVAEKAKICAYQNFDIIASPNYVNAIYDSDSKDFGTSGPSGSAELKALFQEYFQAAGRNYTATQFNGRCD